MSPGRNTVFPAASPLEYAVKCSDYGALHDLLGAGAVAGAEDRGPHPHPPPPGAPEAML